MQRSRKKTADLPKSVALPSGRIALLAGKRPAAPLARDEAAPLFSEMFALESSGALSVRSAEGKVAIESLTLSDFHALRAIVTAAGFLEEEEVEFPCRNCGESIAVFPCREMPLGPFRDRELGDEELDATLPFGEAHAIAEIPLGRARSARTITFAPRTAKEAQPMFRALAKDPLKIDARFVRAMGIDNLGPERDPAKIARALSTCDDDAFDSVATRFLESHYPLRLGAVVTCDKCGARNDVDAPYDRELEPGHGPDVDRDGATETVATDADFPSFDAFSEIANTSFERHMKAHEEGSVDLVIDDGVPACDDGGEPLLGSYVPGVPASEGAIGSRPTVTLYVRTFRSMWNEDGPYDVSAEIEETVEHELEHHGHALVGHDPMDEEERRQIREEAARVIGKKELARAAARGLGSDFGEFLRRTWPLWILVLVVVLGGLVCTKNME